MSVAWTGLVWLPPDLDLFTVQRMNGASEFALIRTWPPAGKSYVQDHFYRELVKSQGDISDI